MIHNTPKSSNWLLSLDDIDGADLPLVGGKAYRLAVLKQHGLNVLPGLVLTTQFFETHLSNNKLTPLWAGSPDIAVTAEALSWLADALKTKPLDKQLSQALNARLDELFGAEVDQFAVRSSAIDEDQRDYTFAGIHLTELGVPRTAIPIAISRCWASALAEPAIQYRQNHGMSIQSIRIAVLIQPMLSPKFSGVGFTFNPVSGTRDEMIIEATVGLGKSIVSGETKPYLYRVAYQPPQFPLLQAQGSEANDPGPLSKTVIRLLAAELQRVEALMGEPQDVEWAYQANQLFLLQARPAKAAISEDPLPGQMWVRSQELPFLPDVPSPYWGDLLARSQPQIIKSLVTAGFDVRERDTYEKVLLGRPYLNLTLLRRMAAQLGLTLSSDVPPASVVDLSLARKINWQAIWRARTILLTSWQTARKGQNLVHEIRQQVEPIITALGSTAEAGTEKASSQLRQQIVLYQHIAVARLQLNITILLVSLSVKQTSGLTTTQILAAAQPTADLDFTDFDRGLDRLVNLIRDNKWLQDLQADNGVPQGFAGQIDIAPEVRHQLDELFDRFPDHGDYPADPGQPRYWEAPDTLLALLDDRMQAPGSLSSPPEHTTRPYNWRYTLAQPMIKNLRQLLRLRNRLEQLNIRSMAACRRWGQGLGRHWFARGWLAEAEDIFWLTMDEIEQVLVAGESKAVTLSATVKIRRTNYITYRDMQPPVILREDTLAAVQIGGDAGLDVTASVAVGLPVSPGQVRGTVVVLNEPDPPPSEIDELILVLPSTGPDWLPLLHRAAGLIVETGGLLSHGSVIAREYEIPAVANIPHATQRYQSGDRVLVDGSTGVVQLLETSRETSTAAQK